MAAVSAAERAQQEQIQASREAAAFFQLFDKSTLHGAAAQRDCGWLLGEKTREKIEGLTPHIPITNFSTSEGDTYAIFVPREGSTPLRLAELARVVWEIAVGVYVFNSVPNLSLQRNHDKSSSCSVSAGYHDTLVGSALFEVDYFIKSLLHGTAIPQARQRDKVSEGWRKMAVENLRESYREQGMVYMIDDPELGHDLYEPKKAPFIRHPPQLVDSSLAESELTPRLTTGEEFLQQVSHVNRDVFLRYLDNAAMSLIVTQRSIKQGGGLFVVDPAIHITSTLSGMTADTQDPDLHRHLSCYLQSQQVFVMEHLRKKKEISHYLDLLSFASFITQLLVTLKHHKKIVSFAGLPEAKIGKALHTSREVPPVLPSESSRWSTFTATNSYSSLQGEVGLHLPQMNTTSPGISHIHTISI